MITPMNDRFMVEPTAAPEVSKGGIILPESQTHDNEMHGVVVSVGRGHLTESGAIVPLAVKVGDTVAFPKGQGLKYKHYVILHENAIFGVVNT